MAARTPDPIRLSAETAAYEFYAPRSRVKRGLRQLGIKPGSDQKYSIHDIVRALFSNNDLEQRGVEARWNAKIYDAELKKLRLEEEAGKLWPSDWVKARWRDQITKIFQFIRHSTLTKPEQRQLISQIETGITKDT